MGMLTGLEILRQMELGNIKIDPFDPKCLNPNSYNLHLSNQLKVYEQVINSKSGKVCPDRFVMLSTRGKNKTVDITIPDTGYLLLPGVLYLGSTIEYTETDHLVPSIDGRSSAGRIGLSIHETAGFGDIGFKGRWTLEITVTHAVKVFPGDEICQIHYDLAVGDDSYKYNGRYQGQQGTVESRIEAIKKGSFEDYDSGTSLFKHQAHET